MIRRQTHLIAHAARGLTLVESLAVLAVTAVALGAALPSFNAARERRHLEGVAAQLETDVQLARSAAVARNRVLRISFSSGTNSSCYVVHTGNASQCGCAADGSAVCSANAEAMRVVRLGTEVPVQLLTNSPSIAFDPVKGTITPTATIKVLGANGVAIHQIVNVMGRVRSCTPGGALPGYQPC